MEDPSPLCLTCADLDHLVFLPAGERCPDTAGQEGERASGRRDPLQSSRHRYERQGQSRVRFLEFARSAVTDRCRRPAPNATAAQFPSGF